MILCEGIEVKYRGVKLSSYTFPPQDNFWLFDLLSLKGKYFLSLFVPMIFQLTDKISYKIHYKVSLIYHNLTLIHYNISPIHYNLTPIHYNLGGHSLHKILTFDLLSQKGTLSSIILYFIFYYYIRGVCISIFKGESVETHPLYMCFWNDFWNELQSNA